MSNYLSDTVSTVFGDKRIIIGTLVLDDGYGGSAAQPGMANVDFAIAHGKGGTAADCAQMTYVSSGFKPLTGASGLSFKVMVIGD